MTIQQILDAPYLVQVILEHLNKPTETTRKVLTQQGISDWLLAECSELKHLLTYHNEMVISRFTKQDYPLLRIGLQEYWDIALGSMFEKLHIVDEKGFMLDYGCGAGQVSDQFIKNNPRSQVLMVDKEKSRPNITQIDFENHPDWYLDYLNMFDYVVLSEVLHCKTRLVQGYLVNSSHVMLKPEGSLIVVENIDYMMEYRISKLKGSLHRVLEPDDVGLILGSKFKHKQTIEIGRHKIYEYGKV